MSLIKILVDLVPCVMGISSQAWGYSPKKGNTEKATKAVNISSFLNR